MPEFERLSGATILRIGRPLELDVEGGGLAIEFCQQGSDRVELLVLAFNELGFWLEPDIS